ncbi:PIG-L deacetylase family protein [Pseudomonas borbori]
MQVELKGSGTPLRAWKGSWRLAQVPSISSDILVPYPRRAVIVAPHPDDEVLGCGGLLQLLCEDRRPLLLISVTNGSNSHQGSSRWTAQRLGIVRPQESADALNRLGLPQTAMKWIHGGFPDSALADYEDELKRFLLNYLLPSDVVFSSWREDGHSDHEAVGRATLQACREIGALFHEVPICAWHWADPEDSRIPWHRARKVHLAPRVQARKRHAIQAFASQLYPDEASGQANLTPPILERLQQPFEIVFL